MRNRAWMQFFAGDGAETSSEAVTEAEAAPETERERELRRHFDAVLLKAENLKALVPDFDLMRALDDAEFVRRSAPGMLPADEAYVSLHYREILEQQARAIARLAQAAAAQSVAAGGTRPVENGSAATAPVAAAPNLRKMSPEERRSYIMSKYPTG